MATPVSGQISLSDMRSEITRGSAAVSASQIRAMVQGGTGAFNFSTAYGMKGFPNETMGYLAPNKYVPEMDGMLAVTAGNTYYQIQTGVDSYLSFLTNSPASSSNSSGIFAYANGAGVTSSTSFGENQLTGSYYNGVSYTVVHDVYIESTGYPGYFKCTSMAMANSGTANIVLKFSG